MKLTVTLLLASASVAMAALHPDYTIPFFYHNKRNHLTEMGYVPTMASDTEYDYLADALKHLKAAGINCEPVDQWWDCNDGDESKFCPIFLSVAKEQPTRAGCKHYL